LVGIKWGIAGVAASYSITLTSVFSWYVWYASKDSPVRFSEIYAAFGSALFPAIIAGLGAWLARALVLHKPPPILSLGSGALLFLLFYMAIAMLIPSNAVLIRSGIASVRKAVGV